MHVFIRTLLYSYHQFRTRSTQGPPKYTFALAQEISYTGPSAVRPLVLGLLCPDTLRYTLIRLRPEVL